MITDAIINAGSRLFAFVVGLFPSTQPPSWLNVGGGGSSSGFGTQSLGGLVSIVQNFGLVSHWFPVGLLGPAVAIILTCMGAGFAVRVGRMVLSVFTGGGGSAG